MAENRIRIEVDYDKAVAKVEDLRIKFEDLGTKVTATRSRIQKAVLGTTDAIDGSVKALMREKGAWQEVQSSLSTTNAQYRVYQAEIDKIDAQIAKLTDTRKREEIALKNSAAGLQQQIALIKQEQANRKLSNTQYRVMQEEIDKLQARYDALTNTKQRHQIVQKGSIADFDQQIAQLREEQRNMALSAEAVDKYEQKIEQLRIRKRALTGDTKNLDKASQSYSSSAGAAGATVTEFGRTIGDLPFGLMGITNNIQQLSQQFVDLQAKSGGTRAALQSVMKTMLGPAGFVVAINIVTSAILYFSRQKEQATKETEDFNESMLLEAKTLKSLINIYDDINTSGEERLRIIKALSAADEDLAKALERAGSNEEERNRIAREYVDLSRDLQQAEETRNKLAEDNEEVLKRTALTQEEQAQIQEYINQLTTAANNNNFATQELLEQRLSDNEELNDILSQLTQATIDAADAQKALNDAFKESELDKVKEEFAEFREELRLETFEEGPERIAEQLRVLRESTTGIAQTYGTDSAEFEQVMLDIAKKEKEYRDAVEEARQEAADAEKERRDKAAEEEKDRLDSLNKLNQKYLDDLETQFDDYGFKRLKQQEDQAIAEAKSLGASIEVLLNIQRYYEGERQKIIAKETEKVNKANKKSAEERSKELQKSLKEQFETEIESMKSQVEMMSEVFSNFGTLLDELGNISQSRFERQVGLLNEQRDIIRTNDALTKEEKEQQLTELQLKENEIQRKRIKAERDMFTLKQGIVLAEMILKQKAFVQEQIMMAQMTAALAKQASTNIALTATEEIAEGTMSIGTFMKQLGPFGIAAFALSIGGVIASIVSARRKAQAEIAGLSDAPISLGGGGSAAAAPASPAFNVVGASAQNQLAAAIAGQEAQPVKAYVVSSDVSTAQELDRKIVEGASI